MSKIKCNKKIDYRKLFDKTRDQLNICKIALCMIYKEKRIDLYDLIDEAIDFFENNYHCNHPIIQRVIALEKYLCSKEILDETI